MMRTPARRAAFTSYGVSPTMTTRSAGSPVCFSAASTMSGPVNMGGRATDVEGIGYPSKTFYIATAAGGIWKTTNNGTTWRPVWRGDGRVISMGDIAIAPSSKSLEPP